MIDLYDGNGFDLAEVERRLRFVCEWRIAETGNRVSSDADGNCCCPLGAAIDEGYPGGYEFADAIADDGQLAHSDLLEFAVGFAEGFDGEVCSHERGRDAYEMGQRFREVYP